MYKLSKRPQRSRACNLAHTRRAPVRASVEAHAASSKQSYDLIVVGSGNGACGFLHQVQQCASEPQPRVLVLEEGLDFFEASDSTHQSKWTQSYVDRDLFQLHNARNTQGAPIISARAKTQGGGGSINYTMMFESSGWLAHNIGGVSEHWDNLKQQCAAALGRTDPSVLEPASPITQQLLEALRSSGYEESPLRAGAIPVLSAEPGSHGLIHRFPTQFNRFGQRTNSGVSMVDWQHPCITFQSSTSVDCLLFENQSSGGAVRCTGVRAVYGRATAEENTTRDMHLAEGGQVVLCAGSRSPRLLLKMQEQSDVQLGAGELGMHVNDHILLPAGLYIVDPATAKVSSRDQYLPVFATSAPTPPARLDKGVWAQQVDAETPVTCLDFYAGALGVLAYYATHLYTALLLPNWAKSFMVSKPSAFYTFSRALGAVITAIGSLYAIMGRVGNLLKGRGFVPAPQLQLVTATVKFVATQNGQYEYPSAAERITLPLFERGHAEHGAGADDQSLDEWLAERELKKLTEEGGVLEKLGQKPPLLVRWLIRLVTGLPYKPEDVPGYVKRFRKNSLLTQQHLAGGCLFQKALDERGRVHGVENVLVADLSAAPLPRISTQMTAYLIGMHVGLSFCKFR